MNAEWNDRYPSQSVLRREVRAMVDAILGALLEELGGAGIRGVYFKGSAYREWESVLDYVPELSDVDIHLWLHEDRPPEPDSLDLDAALRIQAALEHRYQEAVSAPVHMPRPQILLLNILKQDVDYVPPPEGGVEVLYGEAIPRDADRPDAEIRRIDAEMLQVSYEAVRDLPRQAIDRPGRYIWTSLRNLSWRVSPTGPRVLDLLGMDPDQSWSMNRSGVVRALRARGQDHLADRLTEYYLCGWDYFLSGYQDMAAARRALRCGADVVTIGRDASIQSAKAHHRRSAG